MSNTPHDNENSNALSAPSAGDDRFRAIFDAVNDGIFISDPATGQFTEIDEQCCRMFGYPKAELIGRDVDALSYRLHSGLNR